MDGRKRIGLRNYFELPQFVVFRWLNKNLWLWSDEYSIPVWNCATWLWFSDILEFFFWAIFRTSLLVQITFPSSAYVQTVNNNVCNSHFSAIWIEVEYIRKKSDLITSHLNTVWYLDPFPEFFFLKYPSKRSDLNNYYQTFSENFVNIYLSTPSTSRVLHWCLGKKSRCLAYHTSARWVLSLGTIRHNLRVIFSSAALIN